MNDVLSSARVKTTGHYINGEETLQQDAPVIEVNSPLDGSVIGNVPVADGNLVKGCGERCKNAFASWSEVPVKDRAQVLFRFKQLVENDLNALAELVSEENGKTHSESKLRLKRALK